MKLHLTLRIVPDTSGRGDRLFLYRSVDVDFCPLPNQELNFADTPDDATIFTSVWIDPDHGAPILHFPKTSEAFLSAFCVPIRDLHRLHGHKAVIDRYVDLGWQQKD